MLVSHEIKSVIYLGLKPGHTGDALAVSFPPRKGGGGQGSLQMETFANEETLCHCSPKSLDTS